MRVPGKLIINATVLGEQEKPIENRISSIIAKDNEITFDAIVENLSKTFEYLNTEGHTISLKWRDEEQDLITITSDPELQEALSHCQTIGCHWLLRLFLVVRDQDEVNKTSSELAGVIDVFSGLEVGEDRRALIILGAEWTGTMTDAAGHSQSFRLFITSRKDTEDEKRKRISGVIEWSDGTRTSLEGLLIEEKQVKFSEFEILHRGTSSNSHKLPREYVGNITQSGHIEGRLRAKKGTFNLHFVGMNSKNEGFLNVVGAKGPNTKRKYNLVQGDSSRPPTVEERRNTFKKLVQGSVPWYDNTKTGALEPRGKGEDEKKGKTKSCPTCNLPMTERPDANGRRILACSSYPNCKPSY